MTLQRTWVGWGLGLALSGIGACELTEVAAPASADVLVVDAVLRVGAPRQFVLLHRSVEGRVVRGEPGASVQVVDEGGTAIRYAEAAIENCLFGSPDAWGIDDLELSATCYVSDGAAGYFVEPGSEYRLEVVTTSGETARGRTTVPGAFSFRSPPVALDPVSLVADCRLPDFPFTLVWERSEGAWSYVVSLRLARWAEELRAEGVDVPEPLELTSVSVSAADTTLSFPTNIGLFQRGELDRRIFDTLEEGLPAEASAVLVVLAGDRNYTNSIRGGRFNPSGNVRLPSVVGDAVGLFGSVVPIVIDSPPVDVTPCPDPLPVGEGD